MPVLAWQLHCSVLLLVMLHGILLALMFGLLVTYNVMMKMLTVWVVVVKLQI